MNNCLGQNFSPILVFWLCPIRSRRIWSFASSISVNNYCILFPSTNNFLISLVTFFFHLFFGLHFLPGISMFSALLQTYSTFPSSSSISISCILFPRTTTSISLVAMSVHLYFGLSLHLLPGTSTFVCWMPSFKQTLYFILSRARTMESCFSYFVSLAADVISCS